MMIFRKIFDFYLESSIHVALSCICLVRISQHHFNISKDFLIAYFAFFGTIVGYNFVKYEALARVRKIRMRTEFRAIALITLLAFLAVSFCFFQLQISTQIIALIFLLLTLLYAIPFFPNKKNARNWAGVKIYIVALCWVGVTVVLPIVNSDISFTSDFYIKCIQRFILIFVLILIFEIIDLAKDDPLLQTVPQHIGVRKTKIVGYVLMLIFCVLQFVNSSVNSDFLFMPMIFEIVVAIVIVFFLAFANRKRSKYYTAFWVESVPIMWWLMLVLYH